MRVRGSRDERPGDARADCGGVARPQKRGWTETARAFARDAGINEDEWKGPPIEAPQGLLYE